MSKKKINKYKKNKLSLKEQEDLYGSYRKRKGDKFILNPKIFFGIKSALILLIAICYFYYSVALIFLFIAYASLYFFTFAVQRYLNRGRSQENHAQIFKLDAAFAIISIVMVVSSIAFNFSRIIGSKSKMITRYIKNLFSMLTGVRNSFVGTKDFGSMRPPSGNRPSGGRPNINMNDLPLEYAFTQILTAIVQVLIVVVIVMGIISIIMYLKNNYITTKKIKLKQNQKNEWVFSSEDLKRLLSEKV